MVESLHVNHNRWAPNLQLHRLLRLLLLLNRWIAQRLTLAVRKRLSSTFPAFVLSLSGQMIVQAHPSLPLKRSFVLKDQMAGGGEGVFLLLPHPGCGCVREGPICCVHMVGAEVSDENLHVGVAQFRKERIERVNPSGACVMVPIVPVQKITIDGHLFRSVHNVIP
jgi:hypothetical protein